MFGVGKTDDDDQSSQETVNLYDQVGKSTHTSGAEWKYIQQAEIPWSMWGEGPSI